MTVETNTYPVHPDASLRWRQTVGEARVASGGGDCRAAVSGVEGPLPYKIVWALLGLAWRRVESADTGGEGKGSRGRWWGPEQGELRRRATAGTSAGGPWGRRRWKVGGGSGGGAVGRWLDRSSDAWKRTRLGKKTGKRKKGTVDEIRTHNSFGLRC